MTHFKFVILLQAGVKYAKVHVYINVFTLCDGILKIQLNLC